MLKESVQEYTEKDETIPWTTISARFKDRNGYELRKKYNLSLRRSKAWSTEKGLALLKAYLFFFPFKHPATPHSNTTNLRIQASGVESIEDIDWTHVGENPAVMRLEFPFLSFLHRILTISFWGHNRNASHCRLHFLSLTKMISKKVKDLEGQRPLIPFLVFFFFFILLIPFLELFTLAVDIISEVQKELEQMPAIKMGDLIDGDDDDD